MKRALLILLCCTGLLFLSGCLSPIQLSDRALVQAIGVDYQDGNYRLTFQIYTATGGGGQTAVDASQQNVTVLQGEGKTIGDAVQNASIRQGNEMYFGHNQVLLFGESVLSHGIEDTVAYFQNHYEFRYNVRVTATEGNADEILQANINEGILPADTINDMLEHHAKSGRGMKTTFFEMVRDYVNKEKSAVMPLLKLEKAEEESSSGESGSESGSSSEESAAIQDRLAISGAAVIRQDKLAGSFDERGLQGLQLLRNEVDQTTLTLSIDGEDYSLDLTHPHCTIRPRMEGDRVVFLIEMKTKAAWQDLLASQLDRIGEEEYLALEGRLEEEIKTLCLETLEESTSAFHADVLSLSNILWQNHASEFLSRRENWENSLEDFIFDVRVDVTLDRHAAGSANHTT